MSFNTTASLLLSVFALCFSLSFSFSVQAQDAPVIPAEVMRIGGGVVNALAWSPDGESLIVGSSAGAYRLDERLNLVEKLTDGRVTALSWSPDGDALAIAEEVPGGESGSLCSLKISSESGTTVLEPNFCAQTLIWSPDQSRLVLLYNGRAKIVSLAGDSTIEPGVPARTAVWSPDGTQIGFGGQDTLFIWNAETNTVDLARAGQGYGDVVSWADDGLTLLCYERTGTRNAVKRCVFDPSSGERTENATLLWRHPGEVYSPESIQMGESRFGFNLNTEAQPTVYVFASGDYTLFKGSAFALKPGVVTVAGLDGTLRNYDPDTGDMLMEQNRLFAPPLTSVAWSPDGTRLAASSYGYDQAIRVWDVDLSATFYTNALTIAAREPADHVMWTPDGSEIVGWGAVVTDTIENRSAFAWDATSGETSRGVENVYTQFDALPLVAWNADFTRKAVAALDENTIDVGDSMTLTTAAPVIKALAWSSNSDRLASISTAGEITVIEVWNAETGARVSTAVQTDVLELDSRIWWSDTGDMLLVSGRHRDYEAFSTWVYESDSGHLILRYGTPQFYPPKIAWKPDDSLIAVEINSAIVFLSTATTKPAAEQIPTSYINWLDWSPDGRYLAGAGADGTIRVWDVSAVGQDDSES